MATPTRILDHALRALGTLPAHMRRFGRAAPPNWLGALRGLVGPEDDGPYAIAAFDVAARRFTVNGDRAHRFRAGGPATVSGGGVGADGLYTVVTSFYDAASNQTSVTVSESFSAPGAGAALAGRPTHALQELEAVLFTLRDQRSLGAAVGVQLDRIGTILGLARTSSVDADYRSDLYVQAGINVGNGTVEEILAVAASLSGVTRAQLTEGSTATAILLLLGTLVPGASVRTRFRSIRPAGVRMVIEAGSLNPFVFGADADSAGVPSAAGDDVDGSGFGEAFPIIGLNPPPLNEFAVAGNAVAAFSVGETFTVAGSTGNNGTYTVVSRFLVGPNTFIGVAQAVSSPVIDGHIVYGDVDAGDFVEAFAA